MYKDLKSIRDKVVSKECKISGADPAFLKRGVCVCVGVGVVVVVGGGGGGGRGGGGGGGTQGPHCTGQTGEMAQKISFRENTGNL